MEVKRVMKRKPERVGDKGDGGIGGAASLRDRSGSGCDRFIPAVPDKQPHTRYSRDRYRRK